MWMWTLGALALAGEPQIAVSGPGEVHISASDNPVFIASCRGVQWELFNPDTNDFEPAVLPACEETKPAHQIDTNGQLFSLTAMLPPIPDVGFHVVRPVVVYGEKCTENVPFSMAGCATVATVAGPQLAVRNRGAAVPVAASKSP